MTDVRNIAEETVKFSNLIKNQRKKIIALFLGGESMKEANKILQADRRLGCCSRVQRSPRCS
jgi:hypothetical protein